MIKNTFKFFVYIFSLIGLIFVVVFVIFKLGLITNDGIEQDSDYFDKSRSLISDQKFNWMNTNEYTVLKNVLSQEKDILLKVENETGIKSRLIIAILFVEQMRLYNSNTEIFKKIFEPLKILGVQSQFSWGILGLKQDTLMQIEKNLKDSTSAFYLGQSYENLLDFSSDNHDSERFNKATDEDNHYYTYLYASLFIKQIEKQWENAGFNISNKPEVLATLYNIGFSHSLPNNNPKVGGSIMDIGGQELSFGELAYQFYFSDELIDVFPR